jgi:hypothetical protein
VIGAVIELGLCLDLTTSTGLDQVKIANKSLADLMGAFDVELPSNSSDGLRRNLDCAVLRQVHTIFESQKMPAVDTVKGVFTGGDPAYPGAGFREKPHIQIAVRNTQCIKEYFAYRRNNSAAEVVMRPCSALP